jgi:hypothetical protein
MKAGDLVTGGMYFVNHSGDYPKVVTFRCWRDGKTAAFDETNGQDPRKPLVFVAASDLKSYLRDPVALDSDKAKAFYRAGSL